MRRTCRSASCKRPKPFEALRALLLEWEIKDPVAMTTALTGAGGFGKTTLAAALCQDEEINQAFDDGILWTTLGETPDLADAQPQPLLPPRQSPFLLRFLCLALLPSRRS